MTFDMVMTLMGWPYDSFDCLLFCIHVQISDTKYYGCRFFGSFTFSIFANYFMVSSDCEVVEACQVSKCILTSIF